MLPGTVDQQERAGEVLEASGTSTLIRALTLTQTGLESPDGHQWEKFTSGTMELTPRSASCDGI